VITGLMLLANTYLLAWDYDRLRGIFGATSPSEQAEVASRHRLGPVERAVHVVGTLAALAFFLGTRLSIPPREWAVWSMTVGGSSAAIALWLGWSRRSG
jgi:hypothetical protein